MWDPSYSLLNLKYWRLLVRYREFLLKKTVTDPGGGSGGVRILPSRPDACLRLKFLHRQDRISLFNWLIFSMKRALRFATKQNSWDIKKCDCFWVLSSARKAVLPARTATGDRRSQRRMFQGCILYGCIRKRKVRGHGLITCNRGQREGDVWCLWEKSNLP